MYLVIWWKIIAASVLQYKTYKIRKGPDSSYSFIFNDIMGLEQNTVKGVPVEDVKLALRGHVREGYEVQHFELWQCFIIIIY